MIRIERQTSTTPWSVLGIPVASLPMGDVIAVVNGWIEDGVSARLVSFTNVHMIVEAQLKPRFREVLREMDLNCPDGAPIYWLVKRKRDHAEKISGPDFLPRFCEQSVTLGHKHFFYGGAEGVAQEAAAALQARYPGLQVAGSYSPPFRAVTKQEGADIVERINASGADLVWVCLGCPRQERWLNEHRDQLKAKVILAVGQALDIQAGRTSRAPALMRHCGLEWTYRLVKEPGRLWKRYLVTNSLFVLLLVRDKIERKLSMQSAAGDTFETLSGPADAGIPFP